LFWRLDFFNDRLFLRRDSERVPGLNRPPIEVHEMNESTVQAAL